MASLIEQFLYRTCPDEQAVGILSCLDTICALGLDSIEFAFHQLIESTEVLETGDIIVELYNLIESYQEQLFTHMQLRVKPNPIVANELLTALVLLEEFDDSVELIAIIDQASHPEDALLSLMAEALYMDTSAMSEVLSDVSEDLIEKLYSLHENKAQQQEVQTPVIRVPQARIDKVQQFLNAYPTSLAARAVHGMGLSIGLDYGLIESRFKDQLSAFYPGDGSSVPSEFLGLALISNTETKALAATIKKRISAFYTDLAFTARVSYEVDKLCMEMKAYA